jgi:hypothetical protein
VLQSKENSLLLFCYSEKQLERYLSHTAIRNLLHKAGYPAKDVAAFMGLVKLPFACQGPWKIYGDPLQSLGLAEQYRCCRQRMCAVLASGNHKALDLHNPEHPFFVKLLIKIISITKRLVCTISGKEGHN